MDVRLPCGTLTLPAFFPDGTYGTVKCVDAQDLEDCGVAGIVMNGFHLLTKPGVKTLRATGGLHGFTGWARPLLTDSGGFQAFSLIRENPKNGAIRDKEILFRTQEGKKIALSPEKSIQTQFAFGSDILMCLDYCTHMEENRPTIERSVEITVAWAKRCRQEYERQMQARGVAQDNRPLLFAIIQGGNDKQLRRQCADGLVALGFDGYGFGGWPLTAAGELEMDILSYTASLMPDDAPKYAMGLGRPEGIVQCARAGYNLFDCVIPTREARHNRLYVFDEQHGMEGDSGAQGRFYHHHYILDDVHAQDSRPVSQLCDCLLCRRYSQAYLRHLYKLGDSLGYRLATMHNLRFYSRLIERIAAGEGKA